MSFFQLRASRWWTRRKGIDAPLDGLLAGRLPRSAARFSEVEFVALDIETTGLDASVAAMLSVGWVVIRDGKVDLDTAENHIVRPGVEVGHSASVHGLTDTVVQSGVEASVALDKIIDALKGRILVVHHAGLDKALLDRMCRQRFGVRLLVPVVDTLALEQRSRGRRHHIDSHSSLRLMDLRSDYGLPRYAAHDCLVDAIATAELLIAMVAHRSGVSVGDLMTG